MRGCGTTERESYCQPHEYDLRKLWPIWDVDRPWNVERDTSEKEPRLEARFIAVVCEQESTESQFLTLMAEWQCATRYTSSITDIVMHPAYQRIIGLGKAAVPLIMRELSKELDHWFWALRAITGENPVPRNHAAKMDKMAEDWLSLGRKRGWIL